MWLNSIKISQINKIICLLAAIALITTMMPTGIQNSAFAKNLETNTNSETNINIAPNDANSNENLDNKDQDAEYEKNLNNENGLPTFINLNFDVANLAKDSSLTGEISYEVQMWDAIEDRDITIDIGHALSYTDKHTSCINFDYSYYCVHDEMDYYSIEYCIAEQDPDTGWVTKIWHNYITPVNYGNDIAKFNNWQLNKHRVPTTDLRCKFVPGGTYDFTAQFLDDEKYCYVEANLDGGFILSDIEDCPYGWTKIDDDLYYTTVEKEVWTIEEIEDEWLSYTPTKPGYVFQDWNAPEIEGEITEGFTMTALWDKKDDVLVKILKSSEYLPVEDAEWPDYLKPVIENGWRSDGQGNFQKKVPYNTPITKIEEEWAHDYPYSPTHYFAGWNNDTFGETAITKDTNFYPAWHEIIPIPYPFPDPKPCNVSITINSCQWMFGSYFGASEFIIPAGSWMQFNWEKNKFVFTEFNMASEEYLYRAGYLFKWEDWYNVDVQINGISYGDFIFQYEITQNIDIVINIGYPIVSFVAGEIFTYGFDNGIPDGYWLTIEDNKVIAKKVIETKTTCDEILAEWKDHNPTSIIPFTIFTVWASRGFVDSTGKIITKNLTWDAQYVNSENQTIFRFIAPKDQLFDYCVAKGDNSDGNAEIILSGTSNYFVDTFLLAHNMTEEGNNMVVMGNDYLQYSYYVKDGSSIQKIYGTIKPHIDYQWGNWMTHWFINGTKFLYKQNLTPNNEYNIIYGESEAVIIKGKVIDILTNLGIPNVFVSFTSDGENEITGHTITDSEGDYLLKLPKYKAGTINYFHPSAKKWSTSKTSGYYDETLNGYLYFSDNIPIYGSVKNLDGSPVPADIELYDPSGTKILETSNSEADGSFTMDFVDITDIASPFDGYYIKAILRSPEAGQKTEIYTDIILPVPELKGFSVGTLYAQYGEPSTDVESTVQPDPESKYAHIGFIINGYYKNQKYYNEYINWNDVFEFKLYKFTQINVEPWNKDSLHFKYNYEGAEYDPENHYDFTITPLCNSFASFDAWNCDIKLDQYGETFTIGKDNLFTVDDKYTFNALYKSAVQVNVDPPEEYFDNFYLSYYISDCDFPKFVDTVDNFEQKFPEGTEINFSKDKQMVNISYASSKQPYEKEKYETFKIFANCTDEEGVYFEGWYLNGELLDSDTTITTEKFQKYDIKPSFKKQETFKLNFNTSQDGNSQSFHILLLNNEDSIIDEYDATNYFAILESGAYIIFNNNEAKIIFSNTNNTNDKNPAKAIIKAITLDDQYAFENWTVNGKVIDNITSTEYIINDDTNVVPAYKFIGGGDEPQPIDPENGAQTSDYNTNALILCPLIAVLSSFVLLWNRKQSTLQSSKVK